jgi:hypothetical protein
MRDLETPHPKTVNIFSYVPSCEHCIALLLAENIDGQPLTVEHEAWRLTGLVSEILPSAQSEGLTQKEADRQTIKKWVKNEHS